VSRSFCTIVFLVACNGVLREKPVQGDVDAALGVVAPMCDQPAAPAGDGHHHPGEDCLMCHYQGGGGPPFTFGGTLFADSGGSQPVAGATIHLIDANGTDILVTSQTNGNFWSVDLVTFPVIAFGSLCPDVLPMVTPVRDTDGSCNKSGCHTSGFRVHVP
jgi:hypothetical protein